MKICAASPGLSGTPTTVIFASPRSCATPEMIGASIASSAGIWTIHVPVFVENDDRTWIGSA